ncbi:MAG: phage holin family protein [Ileibacterium sp.]|nr:phage holin family protein [Ileibacterium sp.]
MTGAGICAICLALAGFSFFAIGYMDKQKVEPASLWSGKIINPTNLKRKVAKWNAEVGGLLMGYSVFWLTAAVVCFLTKWIGWMVYALIGCGVLIVLASIGVIWRYKQLEKEYNIHYVEF